MILFHQSQAIFPKIERNGKSTSEKVATVFQPKILDNNGNAWEKDEETGFHSHPITLKLENFLLIQIFEGRQAIFPPKRGKLSKK